MSIRMAIVFMLMGLAGFAGCTSVHPRGAAGSGTYSYVSGTLSWTYPVTIEPSWQATLRALEGLDLKIHTKTLDGLEGHIEAEQADKTKVSITLEPVTNRATRINVHVGTFGSREHSKRIHEAIQKQLNL